MSTAIQARNLVKGFKTGRTRIQVLKSVEFDADHGDVTMVMGPSGSGKSTLIAALSGLLRPDEGEVKALGEDIWKMRGGRLDRFRLDHCGFIFQGFNLFPALTAMQQVTTVLKYQGLSGRKARDTAAEALTEVGLGARLHQRPSALSAARSSGSPSPAHWPNARSFCSPTSPPPRSTPRTARSSLHCCSAPPRRMARR
jgi:putative ABC transport system ATP-binding protein